MIANKHISKIIIVITAVAVVACLVATAFASELTEIMGGTGVSMEYETKLFDTSEIIELNIIMDEDDWNDMLSNATSEEYYSCDVVVNGTRFYNVGIRPKGNTSLSNIAMDPDTDRYSFKLEFDQFVEGQTCFGLDKLILNNNYADATNMKEAIVYDMYRFLDADASLYNYAKVSVNGEYTGVYLALEAVEQSFMLRNYGTQDGELYKPDTMEIGGENAGGGFSMDPTSSGGANLNYTDDELDSYQTIWDSEVTSTSKGDHRRVVTALENICEGNDIETYMDVDNILKYMAVHTFAVNLDSLSGTMYHNYYLYEYDGQLNIIPWDYNLSWGGMSGEGAIATSVINDAIDNPFPLTDFFDALLENDEYLARYHEYLQQLVDEYVGGGRFDEVYTRIRSQIDTLVAEDPTAFYNEAEYEAAADMLYTVIKLRAESVDGQIKGEIPSTDIEQSTDRTNLIDGSDIDVSVMGVRTMGGLGNNGGDDGEDTDGGGGGFGPGSMPEGMPEAFSPGDLPEDFDPENMPDMGSFDPSDMPEGFTPGDMPGGAPSDLPDGFDASDLPEGFDPSSMQGGGPGNMGNMPEGLSAEGMPGQTAAGMTTVQNIIILAVCFAVAIVSLVVVRLIKPKNRIYA